MHRKGFVAVCHLILEVTARNVQQVQQLTHMVILETGKQPFGLLQLNLLQQSRFQIHTVNSSASPLTPS